MRMMVYMVNEEDCDKSALLEEREEVENQTRERSIIDHDG